VISEKIKLLADLIRKSHNCVAYTGAGISRASGIADYASKAKNSVAGK
jgi:NAD-dependent SIR2 family protein deacetylase